METTSPQMDTDDGAMATKMTPTSANGKRLRQALLPFKTLAGAVEPSVTVEKRKRKLSKSEFNDDERAPKLNRIDGSVVTNDLLSTEILDESVEYTLTDRKSICKSEVKSMKSESKENVNINERKRNIVDDDDDDDVLELDESSGGGLSDDVEPAEPKARKCLDMNADAKQSKRANDEQLITIKLPMPKKPKEASKKAKKADKAKVHEESVPEIILSDDTDDDKPAKPVQEVEKNSANGAETNASNEAMDSATSDDQLMLTPVSDKGMTPKQAAKRAESEKKLLEKQKAKEQRELERQREKDEKELQRKQEREAKEAQRKLEKEAKEQKRLAEQEEREMKKKAEAEEKEKKKQAEAEEKEKKKQAEAEEKMKKLMAAVEARNEERRKREEQREEERRKREEQKEEERKRREEEKRQREEAEIEKNRKTAAAFAKFFKKPDPKVTVSEAPEKGDLTQSHQFMSFEIKGAMKVAAVTRRQLLPQERADLESALSVSVEKDDLYLKELKTGKHVARQSGKTWSAVDDEAQSEVEDELFLLDANGVQVQVIDDKLKKQIYRAKFFRFHENRRPPYHGTWRKKSQIVGPRRPFTQDKKLFDYEVDSDDEWEEEEEPGESLSGSDDEKDAEPEDDYVIDELFVPHGHLSDEELNGEDEMDEESSLETQQAKLKYIQEAFDKEIHKKTEKLKPRVIGLIWQQPDRSQPANCTKATWDLLQANACMMVGETLSMTPPTTSDENSSDDDTDSTKNAKRKLKISEREVPNLIRLINGNQINHHFLSQEFRAFIAKTQMPQREYSLASIKKKIKELAVYKFPEEGPMQNKKCWYVPIETRKQYGLDDLTLPNTWEYTLSPPTVDTGNGTGSSNAVANDAEKDEKEKKEKSLKDKQKDSDADSDDVMYLSDSNSGVLSEAVTSETVKQASSKSANYNIALYIRPLSKDEKAKQFEPLTLMGTSNETDGAGSSQSSSVPVETKKSDTTPKPNPVKKRVKLLASGPIGQELPKFKENILTKFVIQQPAPADTPSTSGERPKSTETAEPATDVIVID